MTEKMMTAVDSIETTELHKQNLMHQCENIQKSLDESKDISDEIIFHLLKLCGQLLGFAHLTGGVYRSVLYYQNDDQHYASVGLKGTDSEREMRKDQKNIISTRAKIVAQLKCQGFSNFQIATILKITEYQVMQLKKLDESHEA